MVRAKQTQFEPLKVTKEEPTPGYPWRTESTGMELLWIDAMQLWVGRFEVTNEEYRKMKPEHVSDPFCSPKGTKKMPLQSGRQPVVYVNFTDALEYAAWLTGQERAAGKLPEGWAYRLPSVEEAITYIRAGSEGTYPWGNEMPPRYGNYADESLKEAFFDMPTIQGYRDGAACTAWVEASGQNGWGLYGASGNVWEIASRKPGETVFGGWFGASWDDHDPKRLEPESRYGFFGAARGAVNGFRLVLAPVAGGAGAEERGGGEAGTTGTPGTAGRGGECATRVLGAFWANSLGAARTEPGSPKLARGGGAWEVWEGAGQDLRGRKAKATARRRQRKAARWFQRRCSPRTAMAKREKTVREMTSWMILSWVAEKPCS